MGDKLRLFIGILGNGASMLLYTAPILTFSRVFKKKSTEEFSCFPYVMTLLNCLIYTWYGLPIVSHLWENLPLVTINGVGILLESLFIFIYFCYSSPKEKVKVGVIFVPVVVILFGLTAVISAVVFDEHRHRKSFVGSFGLVASISMYGSPLVVMKKVIETKSVEYMPFYLSFFSFLASSLWLAYGLLSHDLFLASPNMVGTPLGILQLILYFKYKNKETPITTTVMSKWDDENNKRTLELVVDVDHDGDANEKKFNKRMLVSFPSLKTPCESTDLM